MFTNTDDGVVGEEATVTLGVPTVSVFGPIGFSY